MANSGIYSINNTTNGVVYSGAQSPRELFASNRALGWYPEAKFIQTYTTSGTFDAATVASDCNTFLFWVFGAGGGSGGAGGSSPGAGGTGGTTTLSGGIVASAVGGIGSLSVSVSGTGSTGVMINNAGTQGQIGNVTSYIGMGGPAAHFYAPNGELFTYTNSADPSRALTIGAGFHKHPLTGAISFLPPSLTTLPTAVPSTPPVVNYTTAHPMDMVTKVTGYHNANAAVTVEASRAALGQGANGKSNGLAGTSGGQGGGFALATYRGLPSTVTITIGAGGTAGTTGGAFDGNVGGGGFVIVEGFIL